MLYPQSNALRQSIDLSGFWDFRFDKDESGLSTGWQTGFEAGVPIAVPASWNDQFEEDRDYLGPAWYQTRFDLPWGWADKRAYIRFGSVNYLAEVWLNGQRLGQHEGGHLPFEFEITHYVQAENNLLVVRVDGRLSPDHVPPGNLEPDPSNQFAQVAFPATNFDFYPFCGIHRPVLLYATPQNAIADVTVTTTIAGVDGSVEVHVKCSGDAVDTMRLTLRGHGTDITAESSVNGESASGKFHIAHAAFWEPESPNLYDLTIELVRQDAIIDRYTLLIGIRTIQVEGSQLLLNGKPVMLKGFGRHEDFPITGRGLVPAVIIKDYALMHWVGANSFRTTHYPYSEKMMQLADRLGFLVIDEIPAVGLFFREEGLQNRLDMCCQQITELVARDKNHPSVILWSIANEPHSRPHPQHKSAKDFFRNVYDLTKSLDSTRPVTLVSHVGEQEESFEFVDVMGLNRYYGWYTQPGQLDDGLAHMEAEIEALHKLHPNKPLIMAEFGADALPGWHAQPPEMFSEEYQAEMITRYIELFDGKPYIVGQHVWNLCDFKTGQAFHRVGAMNFKGVFTRDRRPKLAAHSLRKMWKR